MTTQDLGLFKALTAKMNYLDQRQRVISQNIANADTPNYKAHDLSKVDFSKVVQKVMSHDGHAKLAPAADQPGHIPAGGTIADAKNGKQKITYEIAPGGNAVVLEEQMVSASKTTMDYNLLTSLYQKNVNMMRTALGRN